MKLGLKLILFSEFEITHMDHKEVDVIKRPIEMQIKSVYNEIVKGLNESKSGAYLARVLSTYGS